MDTIPAGRKDQGQKDVEAKDVNPGARAIGIRAQKEKAKQAKEEQRQELGTTRPPMQERMESCGEKRQERSEVDP